MLCNTTGGTTLSQHSVSVIPKSKWRPVLIFTVGSLEEAFKLRVDLIGAGFLDHSALKIVYPGDIVEVETFRLWPGKKIITIWLIEEGGSNAEEE